SAGRRPRAGRRASLSRRRRRAPQPPPFSCPGRIWGTRLIMTRTEEKKDGFELSDEELKQIVAEADTGGRKPTGFAAKLLMMVALAWSLFQLWIASPLPFSLGVFVL